MRELDYQIEAIRKLRDMANDLLKLQGNHTIIFKAPTGSGKTVMMAEFLKELVSNRFDGIEFAFIWAAPQKLHSQSKEKLEKHYRDSMAIKCSSFEDLSNRMINANEILFLNWESINREDNIYYRENEQEFYLEKVIDNTRDAGRILVLIIDESHHTAGAENTQGLIGMINARLTIAVSATPNIPCDNVVPVHRQKVVEEEMIKKQISINPDFKNTISKQITSGDVELKSDAEDSTNEFVVRKALGKREELSKFFTEEGSSVNPLMLIQIPKRKHPHMDFKDEIIDILKDNHNITTENGKLAIYLAEDKENLATITRNDSPVEVMIFKQAIAIGWDCPRASILVLFRDWRSIVFSIQTVGRIMRMPELKHYVIDDLNVGYIYTNLSDISIHQDIADGYATIYNSQRNNNIYKDIQLVSCHSIRQREQTRLSPNFMQFFLDAAEELDLKDKISTDIDQISQQLITDGVVTDPDVEFEQLLEEHPRSIETHSADTVERKQNEEEIQNLLYQFSIEALSPLYPEKRSVDRINKSIYEFFKNEFFMQFPYASVEVQMIVLSEINRQHFIDVINLAKEKYLTDVANRTREIVIDENWEVPKSVNYSDEYSKRDFDLSIMQPFYESNNASDVEKDFAEFLNDKINDVVWWFKNGERDGTFFAVPRKDGSDDVPFYVDWIVKYKDGRVGLIDTKKGWTAELAGTRSDGLVKYIKEQNQKDKNLFGGIVVPKENSFWYYDKDDYQYDENRLLELGWKLL